MIQTAPHLINLAYFVSALLFITGLRQMSSPKTARSGIWLAGIGMITAVVATFLHPQVVSNHILILVAIAIGGGFAFFQARSVAISNMPEMTAIYNGLGGAAAAGIAIIVLLHVSEHTVSTKAVAVLGGMIGSVTFAGSFMAWAKLKRVIAKRHQFVNRQVAYVALGSIVLMLGLLLATSTTSHPVLLLVFFVLSLLFGVIMTLPIAAADLPVLISIYNAMTGLAVAFEGYVLANPAMIVAGMLVCAAGVLLTRLMASAVNRSLSEIMYSGFGISHSGSAERATRSNVNKIDPFDSATSMAYAERVVIVPGYGMASAQAQHKVQELTQLLEERGVDVRFAIHPVAGRMPGHMNVVLAEAGVPYEKIADLSEINPEFSKVDVVLVIGANDIVNLAARSDTKSPLHGMPILDVDNAGSVIVLKRGDGAGYAGVDNPLLQHPNTRVLLGDAKRSVQDLISAIKTLD
ncbi:MAG: NAD(P)(+) transhydrogenase (Re/Si-specific) subunit beta [Granulosicoccaceae bacterium]